MGVVYVTGHRNPDTDAIAAALGYAELKQRLDPETEYRAVRLGDLNAQTRWLLERSEAEEPPLLPHILLRVRDVMDTDFSVARQDEPVRQVGLLMARQDTELIPIVEADGTLAGVVTERALARRYIRESRETSSLVDTPTAVSAIVEQLDGELVVEGKAQVAGRVWVLASDVVRHTGLEAGDVVVVGDRPDTQRKAIELGAELVIISNGVEPPEDVLELARERGTAVVRSPLDSYVSGRMITLSAPCSTMMDREPLTVRPDDLLEDVEGEISDIHYQAAVAVDGSRPIGLITRASLLHPQPRRVILVDHAEQAQSVHGVETAEIVEILDHHHVGSIETRVPVLATFDPVGSTATLVIERFRQNGMEPARPTAIMLLGAVLSDTVILNSPTTTTRDHEAVAYFGRALGIDPIAFGREMFEETADLSDVPADQIVTRDAKEYESSGSGTICIAQVETVGRSVLDRREELQEAMDAVRERRDYACLAVMVTDIMEKHTALLVSGQRQAVEKALGRANGDGIIDLPGVMSRKKQLAPKLLAAF